MPFANELCKNEKQKQTVAIAKPIVYDMNVWVFIGLPGSGKSTESEKLSTSAVANNPLLGSHFPKVIISKDLQATGRDVFYIDKMSVDEFINIKGKPEIV